MSGTTNYNFCYQGPLIRLDLALRQQFCQYSRTFFVEQVQKRNVFVNGNVVSKTSFLVKNGDQILWQAPTEQEITFAESSLELPIIFEHKDFLVVNKPAGILTHPAPTALGSASVAAIIAKKIDDIDQFTDHSRAGIVHRLDKDTSGVLLVAKNSVGFAELSKVFQERQISKKYLVLVKGIPKQSNFQVSLPIGRNPRKPTEMTTFGIAPKDAVTNFKVLETKGEFSLLEAEILTGRTHQIRVHLKSQGFSVVGDAVYGVCSEFISRQALHAFSLQFIYHGTIMSFESPLPPDFVHLLAQLGFIF